MCSLCSYSSLQLQCESSEEMGKEGAQLGASDTSSAHPILRPDWTCELSVCISFPQKTKGKSVPILQGCSRDSLLKHMKHLGSELYAV